MNRKLDSSIRRHELLQTGTSIESESSTLKSKAKKSSRHEKKMKKPNNQGKGGGRVPGGHMECVDLPDGKRRFVYVRPDSTSDEIKSKLQKTSTDPANAALRDHSEPDQLREELDSMKRDKSLMQHRYSTLEKATVAYVEQLRTHISHLEYANEFLSSVLRTKEGYLNYNPPSMAPIPPQPWYDALKSRVDEEVASAFSESSQVTVL